MTIKKVDGSGTTYTNVATGTGSNSSWVQLSGSYTLIFRELKPNSLFILKDRPAG